MAPPNQRIKLTRVAWEQFTLLVVVLCFHYLHFSTSSVESIKLHYQHELVSLGA
jgi:hypothetical protein